MRQLQLEDLPVTEHENTLQSGISKDSQSYQRYYVWIGDDQQEHRTTHSANSHLIADAGVVMHLCMMVVCPSD